MLGLLFIYYCIIFHMNNCKPTFAPPHIIHFRDHAGILRTFYEEKDLLYRNNLIFEIVVNFLVITVLPTTSRTLELLVMLFFSCI